MKKYDYLIVGAGLYGSVFARIATDKGKKCLVIDRRNHIAGNCYTRKCEDINIHEYGPHIFHTSDFEVWNFVNRYCSFNNYINQPIANYKGEIYNLPFNMNTFSKLFNVSTPVEAKKIIESQIDIYGSECPKNLEEQAISLVGIDIYEKLVKGYTEKQWGRKATEIPAFIIKRLPVRYTYNNNYFNDTYQGVPVLGYTYLFDRLLNGIEVECGVDFLESKEHFLSLARTIIFTGCIDEYYDYKFGKLEYRSLKFEHEILNIENFQGNAVVNYTDLETPFTRIVEHKHFEFGTSKSTVITREYSENHTNKNEPYYPVNDDKNNKVYDMYRSLASNENNIVFGGRLAEYKYYDMDKIVRCAIDKANEIII
jgi:UDP-galactopyranose mutase